MTKPHSLYLDVLRFGAAFTVFLSHCGRVTAGMFWQIQPYGVTAVFVFFVLSGFVIAWVTATREGTLEEYALSRVARLYSVVLPVLIATAVLDHIAMAIDPSLYGPEPLPIMSRDPLYAVLGYALSAVFLSECWSWIVPGSNGPWWSVNYEAWYYVLFGVATFMRGRQRMVALAVAAVVAGPPILIFFPLWLMGLTAWRWRTLLPNQLGAPLAIGAVAAFIGLEALGGQNLFQIVSSFWLPGNFSAYAYIVGALVALLL